MALQRTVTQMKKWKLTPFQLTAELLALLAVAGTAVYLGVVWAGLPEQIPSHFGTDGTPDAFSGQPMLLLFFFLSLGLYLAFTVVSLLPRSWHLPVPVSEKNRPALYSLTRTLIVSMKLISTVAFGWVIFTTANSRRIGILFILLLLAALICSVGAYFVRSFRISLADARELIQRDMEDGPKGG